MTELLLCCTGIYTGSGCLPHRSWFNLLSASCPLLHLQKLWKRMWQWDFLNAVSPRLPGQIKSSSWGILHNRPETLHEVWWRKQDPQRLLWSFRIIWTFTTVESSNYFKVNKVNQSEMEHSVKSSLSNLIQSRHSLDKKVVEAERFQVCYYFHLIYKHKSILKHLVHKTSLIVLRM